MNIFKDSQYNQGVGKYKVLSSNAGVGSIITTKLGFFVMPQSVSLWGFIQNVNKYITSHTNDDDMASIAKSSGVDIIDDPRFISFLKQEQAINNLKCLVEVPHLNLNDWNCPQKDTHPLYLKYLNDVGSVLTDDHFVIPAFHFPRWFYSSKNGLFKEISEWKTLWKQKNCDDGNLKYFAPPRDPFYETSLYFKDNNKSYKVFEYLNQIPMLLICKNGHISDIPWYQLFCAGIEGKKHEITQDKGFPLFQYDCKECDLGGKHELQWIENRNQSESWGLLKCKKCGKNYSLEGIMNIKPLCPGDTPWNGIGTKSEILCKSIDGAPCTMQFVLATSNSVYYADSFSSLYIPICYMNENFLNVNLQKILELLNSKWYPKALDKDSTTTKEKYVESIDIIVENADNAGFSISNMEAQIIKKHFVQIKEEVKDERELYKFEEFEVFSNNISSRKNSNKLEFADIDLPEKLQLFFKKIQQVSLLAITSTQLGFNRVSIPTPKRINGEVIREQGQTIYNDETDGVYTLPANQVLGEGIFFEFNMKSINRWSNMFFETFSTRYNKDPGELGKSLKDEIDEYGAPMFYLLHTFTHIILKELEFSCGYPTASLKERLFYSDRMCGVLIYTTDGAEGSMGGLVWQGQPRLILKIISSALERAKNCSSDPLCWEADQQLNLAACFSCCLVSETSCEQRNLGLDRRALVDEEFGFFRDLN